MFFWPLGWKFTIQIDSMQSAVSWNYCPYEQVFLETSLGAYSNEFRHPQRHPPPITNADPQLQLLGNHIGGRLICNILG